MCAFLDRLGGKDDALADDHRALAKATGEQLYNDLLHARDSGEAARVLIADSAAYTAIAEDLNIYRPKAKHFFSTLGRQTRKNGRP